MARRGLVAIGLLLICIIARLFFKGLFKNKKEGFAVGDKIANVSTIATSLRNVKAVTVDSSGNIYVTETYTETYHMQIIKINPGLDNTIIAREINSPNGIIVDSLGNNLYIADTGNNTICKIVIATGEVITLAGSTTSGSSDGIGPAASFNNPRGITISSNGLFLYIADTGNNAIRKIVIATGQVTTLALTSSLNYPCGITTDGNLNLYVADTGNNKIVRITIVGASVYNYAGSGSQGSADGDGINTTFNRPQGIIRDSLGNLYVTDTDNKKIRKISGNGKVTTLAGNSNTNSSEDEIDGFGIDATFKEPTGITINSSGIIYIADTGSNSIRKIEMTCGPGSQLSNGVCVECPNGTYSTNGLTCIPCATSTGATTMTTSKISCAASACQPGYYLSGGRCVESPAGSFSAGGSATSSTPCAAGFYSAARATSCTACAAGSYSGVGASSCTACSTSLGAKTMGTSTTKCEPSVCSGGYKLSSVNGVNQCSKCLAGTYSGEGATTCTTCATGKFSADGATTCVSCEPGTGQKTMVQSATECKPSSCLAGYKLSEGNCVQCGAGFSSPEGSTTCTSCSAGSYSAAGSASCASCAAGSYSGAGASVCTTCADGTYSASGSLSCTTCNKSAGAATMSSSKTSCTATTCLPGYKLVDGSCEKCGAGFYGADGISCTACMPGLSSEPGSAGPSGCKCPANSYGINNSCTSCPTGSVSPIGSTTVSACTCTANYYGSNGQCTACPVGAASSAGSTTASACVCPPGTSLVSMGSTNYCINIDQANKYSMKAYNPFSKSTYNNGIKTSLLLTKNAAMCPPNSTDPCCSQESSTKLSCINGGFWKPSKVFDTN